MVGINWDAVNSGLLIRVIMEQAATQNILAGIAEDERNARDLAFWKSVVRHRMDITDPMDIEDVAIKMMDFDRTETLAQEKRDAGWHQPWRPSVASLLPKVAGIAIVTLILTFFAYLSGVGSDNITWEGDAEDRCDAQAFNAEDYDAAFDACMANANVTETPWGEGWNQAQPWGVLILIAGAVGIVWVLSKAWTDHTSAYHPQDDSFICWAFYPGRKVRLRSGRTFVVSSEKLPRYEPRRLRFYIPATDGLMWSSEDIVWDDAPTGLIDRSIEQ